MIYHSLKIVNCKLRIIIVVFATSFFFILSSCSVLAQNDLYSPTYKIQWPSVNSGAGVGLSGASGTKMGVTLGQPVAGLYSSTGYRVKTGFQYVLPSYPFTFSVSPINLNFGTLSTDVLTNQQTLTLTATNGSAGGYQVLARATKLLTSFEGKTIANTSCDPLTTCDQNSANTWSSTSAYGFGYNMSGTDIPSDFGAGKYRAFAISPQTAVKVMGKTPAQGGTPGKNKTATMTVRININTTQASGNYQSTLIFTALPIY